MAANDWGMTGRTSERSSQIAPLVYDVLRVFRRSRADHDLKPDLDDRVNVKKYLKWLWVYLGIAGVLFTALLMAFLFLQPFRNVTESVVCSDDEHLVTETQVTRGTSSGSESRDCCAKKTDTRAFGKCDWGSSMSFRDSLPVLLPMALAFVISLVSGVFATLIVVLAIRLAFGRSRAS